MATLSLTLKREWRRLRLSQSIRWLVGGLVLLTIACIALSVADWQDQQQQRVLAVSTAQAQWTAQPDRHPHRVAHFGDYAFAPHNLLALFDPGVQSHTGRVLFLEAHRQNSANFSRASESGVLSRFGTLTPAFLLQAIVPLMLIFIGFNIVSAERESGTLLQIAAGGARLHSVLWAKLSVLYLPLLALLGALWLASAIVLAPDSDTCARLLLLLFAYSIYLLVWCIAIVLVSSMNRHNNQVLLVLIATWLIFCIVLPRVIPQSITLTLPTASKVESELFAEEKLRQMGDSHNLDDPHFTAFRQRVLKKYGVTRIEDLPVNYNGLLMQEGERLTSQVFTDANQRHWQKIQQQNRMRQMFAWLNPLLCVQQLSRAAAGTDFVHYADFLRKAEQRRYQMIAQLNALHTHQIKATNDKEQRLTAAHWRAIARDEIVSPSLDTQFGSILSAIAALLVWLAVLVALIHLRAKQLEQRYET